MIKTLTAVALVLAFYVGATAQPGRTVSKGCPGKNGLTAAEIDDIVKAHNTARAEHKLVPLTWDCKLADMAQEWATRGVFEHRTNRKYGENIFVSGSPKVKPDSAVSYWVQEKAAWDNKTATCAPGKVCTHYTQVVWRKTTSIGCGINRNAPGTWKVLLVCNYDPAGNSGGPPF